MHRRGEPLDTEEIRAEIARRRQRAKDLQLRENLFSFYRTHLKYLPENLKKSSELIYPAIRDTVQFSDTDTRFDFAGTSYKFTYREGPKDTEPWGREVTTVTPATIAVEVDGRLVFEFELKLIVTDGEDGPYFSDVMGEIIAFIDGPWVDAIRILSERLTKHRKEAWDKRPEVQKQLVTDMKKFGL